MELVRILSCSCSPEFVFSSPQTFSAHKKSKKHVAWEAGRKCDKIEATRRDNDIYTLGLKIKDREDTIERLCVEKSNLQLTNTHLQIQLELLEKKISEIEIYINVSHRPKKSKIPRSEHLRPSGTLARDKRD